MKGESESPKGAWNTGSEISERPYTEYPMNVFFRPVVPKGGVVDQSFVILKRGGGISLNGMMPNRNGVEILMTGTSPAGITTK